MAMGRRRREEQRASWIAASELPQSGGHPLYQQVNQILEAEGFDRFVEKRCRRFHVGPMGRPSLPPRCISGCYSLGTSKGSTVSEALPGAWRTKDITAMRCSRINASARFARTFRSRTADGVTRKGSWQSVRRGMGIVAGFGASVASD